PLVFDDDQPATFNSLIKYSFKGLSGASIIDTVVIDSSESILEIVLKYPLFALEQILAAPIKRSLGVALVLVGSNWLDVDGAKFLAVLGAKGNRYKLKVVLPTFLAITDLSR